MKKSEYLKQLFLAKFELNKLKKSEISTEQKEQIYKWIKFVIIPEINRLKKC